jgi:hypothetical protein
LKNLKYEIDNENGFAIKVWDLDNPNESNAPFLFQPSWPNDEPWSSYEEAKTWADQFVAMMNDGKNGSPGPSPSQPWVAYVEPQEEIEEAEIIE